MKLNRNSFSLIEVIASLVILEIVLVSVLSMFSIGSKSVVLTEDTLKAINLLQWKIEEIKTKDFSVNLTENGTSFTGYTSYLFDVVETTPWLSNAFLKNVHVNINWTTPLGVPKNEGIDFVVSNR